MAAILARERWALLLALLLGSEAQAAADSPRSLFFLTSASIHRTGGEALSAAADYDTFAQGAHGHLAWIRQASPSLYARLAADLSGQGQGLSGDGALKILDRLVVGLGLAEQRQRYADEDGAAALHEQRVSESVTLKGEGSEVGIGFWQDRVQSSADGPWPRAPTVALLYAHWYPQPAFSIGVLGTVAGKMARRGADALLGLMLGAQRGVLASELILAERFADRGGQPAELAAKAPKRHLFTGAVYYHLDPTLSVDLRLDLAEGGRPASAAYVQARAIDPLRLEPLPRGSRCLSLGVTQRL